MKIFLSAIIFILSSINLFSETLILKDGSILKVKLKGQDSQNLVYTLKGKDTNISKTKIRKVIYARTPEVENKQIQDELNKLKQEKLSKKKFTPEEEAEAAKELEEEIAKAIAEQERQERLNLSFEERIQKLENEVGDLKSVSGLSDTGDRLAKLESELKELKSRTRRIEKFLDIDPDIEEYYSKPRSMWSVVWRSALLPGWGLSYARDSSGVYYSSLFVVSALGGIAYQESISSAERKLDKKIRDDFFVQPLLQGAFVTGLARTASSTTAGNDLLNTYTQF
ncbi:MAG: hypothetical protein SFU98_01825, partial [Leptospiraceae bacterium]|nr:hypothetical protein [Leptospiraceae bacterium]